MHIELWQENRNKLLEVSGSLNKSPTRIVNEYLESISPDELLNKMIELIRVEHSRKQKNIVHSSPD